MLLRNPCKNLKSYDNPFWKNGDNGRKKEKRKRKEREKRNKLGLSWAKLSSSLDKFG